METGIEPVAGKQIAEHDFHFGDGFGDLHDYGDCDSVSREHDAIQAGSEPGENLLFCRCTVYGERGWAAHFAELCRLSVYTGLLFPVGMCGGGDGHYPYGLDGFGFPYSGMPFAFIVFNPDATSPAMDPSPAIEPFGGQRFGASFSSPDGRNDDWLISPKLRLPAEDAKIALEVKSYSSEYGLEEYNILVSSQGNEPSDFVRLGGTRTAPADRWEHVEVDLDDYAGKEVYLAIQCVSDNRFMFMVDDIEVSRPVSSESVDLASSLYLYPNPAVDEIHILSTADKIEELTVFDAKGIVVSHRSGLGRSQVEQEVEDWEAGMYFARVRTASGVCVLKFLVR